MIYTYENRRPICPESTYVADSAEVIGAVELGAQSSVWFGSVLRGDIEPIRIGARSNIQDLSVAHTSENQPVIVGEGVTVGHKVTLHGCIVGNNCLIGMGAILLDGCEIGDNCIIGAGSLVAQGRVIPPGSMAVGMPARVIRSLSDDEIESIRGFAERYIRLQANYHTGAMKPL